ncbi:uncharacterized protein DS421_6g186590 [Arachis hypogaea]|nr:uncharacterized protein DS421_6g186590 [Arachis hypogaea]
MFHHHCLEFVVSVLVGSESSHHEWLLFSSILFSSTSRKGLEGFGVAVANVWLLGLERLLVNPVFVNRKQLLNPLQARPLLHESLPGASLWNLCSGPCRKLILFQAHSVTIVLSSLCLCKTKHIKKIKKSICSSSFSILLISLVPPPLSSETRQNGKILALGSLPPASRDSVLPLLPLPSVRNPGSSAHRPILAGFSVRGLEQLAIGSPLAVVYALAVVSPVATVSLSKISVVKLVDPEVKECNDEEEGGEELSDIYHSPQVFKLNYAEMMEKFKNIWESRFRTLDPDQAHLFFIPISCHKMRGKGRSPAFNAIASTFEKPKDRNLSTPPPIVRKVYLKSGTANLNTLSLGLGSKSSAIARLTSSFEMPSARGKLIPQSLRVTSNTLKSNPKRSDSEDSMSSGLESLTEEDAKEGEADDDEGLPVYPYDSVNTASSNPVPDNERYAIYSVVINWHGLKGTASVFFNIAAFAPPKMDFMM